MKVKELIELLKEFDPDMPVMSTWTRQGSDETSPVKSTDIRVTRRMPIDKDGCLAYCEELTVDHWDVLEIN